MPSAYLFMPLIKGSKYSMNIFVLITVHRTHHYSVSMGMTQSSNSIDKTNENNSFFLWPENKQICIYVSVWMYVYHNRITYDYEQSHQMQWFPFVNLFSSYLNYEKTMWLLHSPQIIKKNLFESNLQFSFFFQSTIRWSNTYRHLYMISRRCQLASIHQIIP